MCCCVQERGESLDRWAERIRPDFPTILQVGPCKLTTTQATKPIPLFAGCNVLSMSVHDHCAHATLSPCLSLGSTHCVWQRVPSPWELSWQCPVQVLCHVTKKLQRLHEADLVHRDLKPGNVLWRPQHLEWTLIDFGCSAPEGVQLSCLVQWQCTAASGTSTARTLLTM